MTNSQRPLWVAHEISSVTVLKLKGAVSVYMLVRMEICVFQMLTNVSSEKNYSIVAIE